MAMGINYNDPNAVTYVLPDCPEEKLRELWSKDRSLIKYAPLVSNDYPAEMPPQEISVCVPKGKIRAFENAAKKIGIKFSQIRSES